MSKTDFEVWDADNHLYESVDAFTRYLPKEYKSAIRYVEVEGRTKIAIKNKISDYIPNPTFEVVAAPGAWEAYFRGDNPEGKSLREVTGEPIRCRDEFRDPEKRLALFDEQGIYAALMFPTLASLLEERMKDDIELTHAAIHSLNQWILEDWTFDYQGRIFPVPIVTLPDVDKAVAELNFCVENGARTVLVRPAPVATPKGTTTSPGMPQFDPFWNRVQQLGIPVMMHASDSGYDRYASDWEGNRDEFLPFKPNAFRQLVQDSRPIFDTLAALISHGMFHRNPGVRVAPIENGTSWVPHLLGSLERVYKKMPGEFSEDPVETFRRHVWVHPFHEDDVPMIIDAVGVDRVLFGSDYPHPEGLGDPISFVKELDGMDPETVRKIMGANLRELLTPRPIAA